MTSTIPTMEAEDIESEYIERPEDTAAAERLLALVGAGDFDSAYAYAEDVFDPPYLAFLAMILAGFVAI